jgi:hypothetical protein
MDAFGAAVQIRMWGRWVFMIPFCFLSERLAVGRSHATRANPVDPTDENRVLGMTTSTQALFSIWDFLYI